MQRWRYRGGWKGRVRADRRTLYSLVKNNISAPPPSLLEAVVVFPFLLFSATSSLFFHFFCPRGQNAREQHMSVASWTFLVVCCGGRTSNHRNITLMEQAKWALFLKSFFEISEAIPWPRDHILFTFPLPTTQATLAKFTKEDPHWKIRLIPD